MGSSMRVALAAAAALAIMLFAVACGGGDSSEGDTSADTAATSTAEGGEATDELVVTSWGGTFQEDISASYFQPFAEQEGITVKEDENASLSRIKAMVDSGNVQWDVPTVARTDFEVLKEQGLLEPIDYSVFNEENLDNLVEGAADEYGLAMNYYSCGITYRTDLDGHPTSWKEFWDTEAFPGPRALPKATYAVPPWEPALMADGVDPDDLYPLDFERALDSLSKIADDVTMWYDDTAAAVQALVDGDVNYAMLCNNRVSVAAAEGEPVGVEWNQSMLSTDMWVVPKGAPNKVNAMKFLAFTTEPEVQAVFIEKQPTGLPNLLTNDLVSAEVVETLPTTPEHLEQQVEIDASFYVSEGENGKSQLENGLELWEEWFGSL